MSYDLTLFAPRAGVSLEQRIEGLAADAGAAGAADDAETDAMRGLADLMHEFEPAARAEREDFAIVVVRPDEIVVSLRYTSPPPRIEEAWRALWRLLEELERRHGFRAFDPQLQRVLDLATDLGAVLALYEERRAQVEAAVPGDTSELRDAIKQTAAELEETEERMSTLVVIRTSLLADADGPDGERAMARALEVEQELDKLRAQAAELRARAHELRLLLSQA